MNATTTKQAPFRFMASIMIGKNLVSVFGQTFEFSSQKEADFFVSSENKQKSVLKTDSFSIRKGARGIKKTSFFVSVYTPRKEEN